MGSSPRVGEVDGGGQMDGAATVSSLVPVASPEVEGIESPLLSLAAASSIQLGAARARDGAGGALGGF